MAPLSNIERLYLSLYAEALKNFETDHAAARRQLRDLLRRPMLPPLTRAKCNLMMAFLVPNVDDAQEYLAATRDSLAFNAALGRAPSEFDFEADIQTCEEHLQDRRDHPEDYSMSDDELEGDGLTHEDWARYYFDDEADAGPDEPSAEQDLDIPDDTYDVDVEEESAALPVHDVDDEEEPAYLPASSGLPVRSTSRPAEADSATSEFDLRSGIPERSTDDVDDSEL
ncbi:uncharacterized protein K489DRAFT_383063 [Dissoconium aciculare CBS 342.82]|jgi:hypothetical protein|uniref:Uncharacterized protein n=1 Tax=Dissoconium aciculare CBS 342.82 TaxID=1314786 RepID=A0A6J3LY95_9PEZI|nr:uncharacterized protein K489DRAFT_383063 [Dissoconium aciculare CBS 342.82]KAF1820274.1 hypothetical protein K489DRAFT_383063 [Dissoconium aciculare CBS 342.82]